MIQMGSRRAGKALVSLWLVILSVVVYQHTTDPSQFTRFQGLFISFMRAWGLGSVDHSMFDFSFFTFGTSTDVPYPRLSTYRNHPAAVVMYDILGNTTGLDPHQLLNIPYGLIFMPPLALIVGRRLHPRVGLPAAGFIIIAQPVTSYVAGFSLPLVFVTVWGLLVYRTYTHRRIFPLLVIVIIALGLWWHTMLMMAVTLIGSLALLNYLSKYVFGSQPIPQFTPPALVLILLGLATFQMWDSPYVLGTIRGAGASPLVLVENIYGRLTGGVGFEVPYEYSYRSIPGGDLYYYSNVLRLALSGLVILLPATYLCFIQLYKRKNGLQLNQYQLKVMVFAGSIGLAQILFAVLYSDTGYGIRFAKHLFVIVGLAAILVTTLPQKETIYHISLSTILLLAALTTAVPLATNDLGQNPRTEFEDSESAFEFTTEIPDNHLILADFHLTGMMMYREVETDSHHEIEMKSPRDYGALVGDRPPPEASVGQFVIVDERTIDAGQPVHGYPGRALYRPIPQSERHDNYVDKVYTDSGIAIYRYSGGDN